MIRLFKVASESSVSSGVRRIEAITGDLARTFLLQHTRENLKARFQAGLQETMTLPDWIEKQKDEVKQLHRQIGQMKAQLINVDELLATAKPFQTQGQAGQLVMVDIPMDDRKVLSEVGDKIRHQLQSGVVIMIGQGEQSHPIIVSLTKNLVGTLNAGHILKEISQEMGGKGGGRPDFAQGSAPQRENLPQAFAKARQLLGLS